MSYNVFFTEKSPDIQHSIYELYFNDLLKMHKDEFFDNSPSFENKNVGHFNRLLLKETIEYFSNLEEYEKCSKLIKLKKEFKIKFRKS